MTVTTVATHHYSTSLQTHRLAQSETTMATALRPTEAGTLKQSYSVHSLNLIEIAQGNGRQIVRTNSERAINFWFDFITFQKGVFHFLIRRVFFGHLQAPTCRRLLPLRTVMRQENADYPCLFLSLAPEIGNGCRLRSSGQLMLMTRACRHGRVELVITAALRTPFSTQPCPERELSWERD